MNLFRFFAPDALNGMRKRTWCFTLLFFCVLLLSCASRRDNNLEEANPYYFEPFSPYKTLDEGLPFVIEDYQNKKSSAPLPLWLSVYYTEGTQGIEKLSAFDEQYCFILEQSSLSLNILLRRALTFKTEHDFSRMVFQRIYKRAVKELEKSPDIVFGSVFEKLAKTCMQTYWIGAKPGGSCWTFMHWIEERETNPEDSAKLRSSEEKDKESVFPDTYKLFIMVYIDKKSFQRQFKNMLSTIAFDKKDTKEQRASFEHLKNDFFDDF